MLLLICLSAAQELFSFAGPLNQNCAFLVPSFFKISNPLSGIVIGNLTQRKTFSLLILSTPKMALQLYDLLYCSALQNDETKHTYQEFKDQELF